MSTRRGFLKGAMVLAPAIVHIENIMRIATPPEIAKYGNADVLYAIAHSRAHADTRQVFYGIVHPHRVPDIYALLGNG